MRIVDSLALGALPRRYRCRSVLKAPAAADIIAF
jgi:hypothetical protein